jgi:hypothetical protein
MYRIISNRAPHIVSNIRALYSTSNGIPKLLRRVDAPVCTRPRLDVHRQFLAHATSSSSRQITGLLEDGKQLAQPALFRHLAETLTGMQALIRTATRLVDGSVAMHWSENRVLYTLTLMLYVVGLYHYVLAPALLLRTRGRKVALTECLYSTLTTLNVLLRDCPSQ